MKGKKSNTVTAKASLRVKIILPGCSIGPGKIRLLEGIAREGSISAAAREQGLSYRRAWHLIETLNAGLKSPVVETNVGGTSGGGAALTETGKALIRIFNAVVKSSEAQSSIALKELKRLMR